MQDYVEILTRRRIAEMPDGVWETEDYIDYDPSIGEGLIPIKVKMTIEGDQLSYDLSGSHPAVGTFLNAGFGSAFSGVIAGTKTFFPDVPLNSGFYRAVQVDLGPVGSVVNAPWPIAVTGFCSGPYEKIMNAIFELWSKLMPERALACSFNLEYLLVGGRDARLEDKPYFMWYDWMVGGWGGRNGRDGSNCTAPIFGVGPRGAAARGPGAPVPGRHDAARDPHRLRRARAVPRRLRRREGRDADRRRAHGDVVLVRPRALDRVGHRGRAALAAARRLAQPGQRRRALPRRRVLQRPDQGGRHVHAPLRGRRRLRRSARARSRRASARTSPTATSRSSARSRTTASSSARSTPTSSEYEVDLEATKGARASIAAARRGWLEEDAESVAERYREGELDVLDLVRHYGVILDWGTGELLPKTTVTFREMIQRRSASHWPAVAA